MRRRCPRPPCRIRINPTPEGPPSPSALLPYNPNFPTMIGTTVLDVQARDCITHLPTVVNGFRLVLSKQSASGYLGVRKNVRNGKTSYTARASNGSRGSLGHCRVQ